MYINFNDQVKTLIDIQQGKHKEALKLDIPEIDEYIRLKKGLTIILGHANVGKTSLVLFLMLCYAVRHGQKFLIYSSENEPYELLKKLMEYLLEDPLQKIIPKDFNNALDFIKKHFLIMDNSKTYTYEELLEAAEKTRLIFKYDGFLIDPYNSLVRSSKLKDMGAHEYDYEAATRFRIFCQQWDVSIWLCGHANTEAARQKYRDGHQYAGYPVVPSASHMESGSKWNNRCDQFLVVHRLTQHPTEFMYTQLHCVKQKSIESGGRPTSLDLPIMMRALINNVGYSINNESVIKIIKNINAPF
jgi:hypothetical protein